MAPKRFDMSPSLPPADTHTAVRSSPGGPGTGRRGVRREYNVLALIKGNERYVFVYDDEAHEPLVDALRDNAADPHLSFTWFDAAVLTEKAREQARAAEQRQAAEEPLSRPRI